MADKKKIVLEGTIVQGLNIGGIDRTGNWRVDSYDNRGHPQWKRIPQVGVVAERSSFWQGVVDVGKAAFGVVARNAIPGIGVGYDLLRGVAKKGTDALVDKVADQFNEEEKTGFELSMGVANSVTERFFPTKLKLPPVVAKRIGSRPGPTQAFNSNPIINPGGSSKSMDLGNFFTGIVDTVGDVATDLAGAWLTNKVKKEANRYAPSTRPVPVQNVGLPAVIAPAVPAVVRRASPGVTAGGIAGTIGSMLTDFDDADIPIVGRYIDKVTDYFLGEDGKFYPKPKRRRRRRRLATCSDIKDLASLKAILGGGALFKEYIATNCRR